MPVITVSRQYGSYGEAVALQVSRRLGYHYFDKELMARVAAEVGLAGDDIVDLSEENYKAHSFLDHLLIGRSSPQAIMQSEAWQAHVLGKPGQSRPYLDEQQSISLVRQTVRAAHRQGNIIIVGRGGQLLLQNEPDVLHVRIEAPFELRVRRVQTRLEIGETEAGRIVSQHDRAAVDYLKHFYNVDISDSSLYHLVVNTGKWAVAAAAELLQEALQLRLSSPT